MKKLKLFFALFAMLALGTGTAWGAEVTETIMMKGFGGKTNNAYQNVTVSGTSDAGTAMVAYAYNGSNGQVRGNKTIVAGASVTSEDKNKNWSLYNSEAMGGSIKSITVTQTATGVNKFQNNLYVSLGTSSQGDVTAITNAQKQDAGGTANEINFTIDASNGYTYFKLLSSEKFVSNSIAGVVVTVTYETASSGGGDEPVASLSADPTTIDFGTVYQGATVTDQTIAVNFENLTGNVTYSGLSTPFSATGNISTTGDKITISADASTIGEYSQTLTVASTADSKTAEVIVKMNVVAKPAPTGTFTLHTGELIEGDYVIYYSGKAMKAEVASNRLQYVEVTPSNNEIVDPAAAAIWHIAKSGANWTVYNNNKGYAAGTGTKSQAGLVTNLTGDNANKAAWTVTASGNAYEFVNVWNKSKSVNANLRNNTTYGFACYATGTGGALSLYRKAGTKYNVNISATTNGTVTADPTSAEAGTTITLTVTPVGGYVLDALTVTDASSNPVTVTDNKFTMPASDVTVTATFKANEKPAATLTLSKNGVEETFPGSWKQDDVVTLPTTVDTDCVKEFVGWSADANCATEPEYARGASYTLASTSQTLYAVYATVQGGGEATSEDLFENNGTYNSTAGTITWELANVVSILQEKSNASSSVADYVTDPRWYKDHLITITPSANIKEIVVKAQSDDYAEALANSTYNNATATINGDIVTITPSSANEVVTIKMGAQARLNTLTVTYAATASYSNYSTTCAAALANPTFSLAEGKYTEAKSVEITATEGTVYYTTDGTTPTASNTQYTGAIALNDCGEYTIKAIAISADSQSDVVSATYTIKLPLTNSQVAPYTEAEAIAVYDGDCYDNQDVYVKGTVKTATFYTSGTYTVTLTNGFQFYKFYKDGSKTLFADGEINKGDVLVACGKLSKYNTTYQLAEGCYLVAHEPYTEPKVDISNTEASAYTVDKAFELIADVSSDLTKEVYVKGLVAVAPTSNPTADGQMTYSISDNGEKTGKVLKVYLGLGLNGDKFTSKNDVQQGDYVVVKGKLLDYNSTYELNKGNQLVQHVKAATISIADITMEVGETKTIAATITPAAAKTEVTYSIKENAADAISLSGNTITANSVGSATITATIATAADYMGKTVDFTVTVTPKTEKTDVVILAELNGKWYAMKGAVPSGKSNQLDTLEVKYVNGTLYNVADADKSSITWTRSVVDGKATFVNNGKYLKGGTSTDLTLVGTVDDACKWMWNEEDGYYTTNTSGTIRTFLYRENYNFKNYGVSQAGKEDANGDYSALPVVTAPVYVNLNTSSVKTVEKGIFSVGDGKFVQFSTGNLQYEVGTNTWSFASEQYEVIGGEAYTGSNNTNYGMNVPGYTGKLDLFAWSSDGKFGVNPSNLDGDYGYAATDFVDWGNLVNEEGWYTLTATEMNYLLNRKKDGKKLWALATVCGMNGLILLPDNWNTSTTLEYGYIPADWNYTKNQLDDAAWAALETAGAVFLPEGGSRVGGYGNKIGFDGATVETDDYFHVDNVGDYGYYWLNTQDTRPAYPHCASYLILPGWSEGATDANEDDICLQPQVWSREKRRGNSVRLVKAIEPDYTREVRQGYYGTICLENGGQMIGASRFGLSYYNEAQGLLYMDEADATMVAGNPYIFLPNERATKDSLYVFYDETTAAAKTVNGLVGSFESKPLDADGTNYIMKDNKIMKVVGEYASVGAYKAYIKLGDVSKNEPAPVPGRRRVAIGQAPQVATGMESVDASAQPVKMIIDGQLYILRGEKMYDAQGKLVK